MNTPIKLKNFFTLEGVEERLAVVQSLVLPEKKGEIITVASLADEEITKFFDRYHEHASHATDPDGKLHPKAVFADKIKTLKDVLPKLDPTPSNYEAHLSQLDTLRLVRNKAGHGSGISLDDATELAKNPEVLALIDDFPKTLWDKVTELNKYLNALLL